MARLRFYIFLSVLTSLAILLGVAFCVANQQLAQKFDQDPARLQALGVRLLVVGSVFKVGVIVMGAWRLSRPRKSQSTFVVPATKNQDSTKE
jgi:formate hydrogenlyase subunit 3/multisubunit Na+/H+ antiporter MnhD subunit